MREPGLDLNLSRKGIYTCLINWPGECYSKNRITLTFLLDNCPVPPWHCGIYHLQDYILRGRNSQWMMIYTPRNHLSSYHFMLSLKHKEVQKKKKKVFSCLLLPFTDLLVSSSHKRVIYDSEPRKPGEFYARRSLISLSYLISALLKDILTTVNLGPRDFVASQ